MKNNPMPAEYNAEQLSLSAFDRACLNGAEGSAIAKAMRFLVGIGQALGAHRLIDVEHCHLVGSYYSGVADVKFLQQLVKANARVRVPTTLNASSACLERKSPSPEADRAAARGVVELYTAMGCEPQLTCAPYHLPHRPSLGSVVAWAESNAVVFANSVLGARSNKTVQYLDLCAALTGRIPESGLYLDSQREPTCHVDCSLLPSGSWDFPLTGELIGLWLGYHCGTEVPILSGCDRTPGEDLLRGLGAAAASSGAVSLFHFEGVTPEAHQYRIQNLPGTQLTIGALTETAAPYRGIPGQAVSAICLGTPHYSLTQLRNLAEHMIGTNIRPRIPIYVTTSRYNRDALRNELLDGELAARGVQLLVDTCSYYGRAVPLPDGPVLTDSAKWAYYGAGNLGVTTLLGELEDCLATAASGRLTRAGSFPWL
ncbi:DUF521 domain-containing protein [Pseudohalioglobus sediminis]|uniref:DUF521 domain-containing protein n=1 Tax=Pseudohalioglobus sediminis TaxID=2606449 RepID=A0A5B0WPL6_9GAMM|nr:aconitase X [Pseudohalioglobus sediminis]KAA1188398.1 DUF521 domain-containing protein [Pseudohalioglobus sediminis]